jgi:hypothetical protein
MSAAITGTFATRRDAEMAVERLVQEFGVERTDIFIAPEGDANSAGLDAAGSDMESRGPSHETREDGAHEGAIIVSVDVNDDETSGKITDAFEEFGGTAEVEG